MSNALVYLLQPRRILLDFWQKDTACFPPSRNTTFPSLCFCLALFVKLTAESLFRKRSTMVEDERLNASAMGDVAKYGIIQEVPD
eukprot:scaffold183126_cov81-Cyclotella_meneghiniana.AAC.3